MKPIIFMPVMLFFWHQNAISQENQDNLQKSRVKSYNAKIFSTSGNVSKGWLYSNTDDSIYILPLSISYYTLKRGNLQSTALTSKSDGWEVSQVTKVVTRGRNSVLKGALIGLASGVVIGTVAGLASGDDPVEPYTNTIADIFVAINNSFAMTAGEKAAAMGITIGGLGALAGTVIGALAKKTFYIGGDRQTYRQQQEELRKRALIH